MVPKVMRSVLSTGSRPQVLRNSPSAAAISPFTSERPASAAIMVKEKRMIVVSSLGPKVSAMAAKGAASRMRTMSENVSPKTEE